MNASMSVGERYYTVLPGRKFVQAVTIVEITQNTVLLDVDADADLSQFGIVTGYSVPVRYVSHDVRWVEPAPAKPEVVPTPPGWTPFNEVLS